MQQFIDSLDVPISDEAFTGYKRIARHRFFGVMTDLNMLQQVDIIHVNEAGIPIHQVIEANSALTPAQKETAKLLYPIRTVSTSTSNSFCDPETGAVLPQGTPGSIPERDFFQAITIEQILAMTGLTIADSFAHVLYTMLANQTRLSDGRGKF
ncbi:hypothetical protein A6C57_00385 [Fibrella sp. ES10-3-2-2]|nr:hypothetical protein A6C57_00385 [Fibrella sp. ES10-3-2-2]